MSTLRDLPLSFGAILTGLTLAGGAVVAGFYLDAESFAGNLLGEVTGVIGGVFLAALYIDVLLARERTKRWKHVSRGTAELLRLATVKTALSVYLMLPAPRDPDADPFVGSAAGRLPGALGSLLNELRDPRLVATGLGIEPPAALSSVEPDLRSIREVLLPRLLAVDVVPDLVGAVINLERAHETLDYHARTHSAFGTPPYVLVADLTAMILALKALVEEAERSLR